MFLLQYILLNKPSLWCQKKSLKNFDTKYADLYWIIIFQKLLKTTSKKSVIFLQDMIKLSLKNISKEHHKINKIFSYLNVTENIL